MLWFWSDSCDLGADPVFRAGGPLNPFRYTAREFDEETGLYYYRARYYESSTGRFLSEDPVRFRGGWPTHGSEHASVSQKKSQGCPIHSRAFRE